MEGVSPDDLREELVPGRAPLFAAGSVSERLFAPFCVDTKSFVDDRLVTWLELLIVTLNVVNISLYFAGWSVGVDRYVGTIAVSRMVMAVAVWMLQRDNLDGRVLRAQFRDATNWISNVLIIVNVIMIPVVRLWMRFETSWPGGGTRVAFEKAADRAQPAVPAAVRLLHAARRVPPQQPRVPHGDGRLPDGPGRGRPLLLLFPSLGLNSSPSLNSST